MFEACVHVTNTVLLESSSGRSDARSLGLSFVLGVHHLMTRLRRLARSTQEAMLASWSIDEMTNSEPSGNSRAYERLRKSWVVEEPKTGRLISICGEYGANFSNQCCLVKR